MGVRERKRFGSPEPGRVGKKRSGHCFRRRATAGLSRQNIKLCLGFVDRAADFRVAPRGHGMPCPYHTPPSLWLDVYYIARLCENSVHAFLRLRSGQATSARTGCGVSKIKYSTVRPELSRRAPIEFSHSLSQRLTRPKLLFPLLCAVAPVTKRSRNRSSFLTCKPRRAG